jgi:hypothetical protein
VSTEATERTRRARPKPTPEEQEREEERRLLEFAQQRGLAALEEDAHYKALAALGAIYAVRVARRRREREPADAPT